MGKPTLLLIPIFNLESTNVYVESIHSFQLTQERALQIVYNYEHNEDSMSLEDTKHLTTNFSLFTYMIPTEDI